jgi:TIR domain
VLGSYRRACRLRLPSANYRIGTTGRIDRTTPGSEMAESEWRPAFNADPSGEGRRLLPVRVEEVEPAGLLADRVYIDLVGADEATARARVREEIPRALRGPGRPATAPRFPRAPAAAADRPRFPTALPPCGTCPSSATRRSPAASRS